MQSQIEEAIVIALLQTALALAALFGYHGMASAKNAVVETVSFFAAGFCGLLCSLGLAAVTGGPGLITARRIGTIVFATLAAVSFAAAPRMIQRYRQTNIAFMLRLTFYAAVITLIAKSLSSVVIPILIWIGILTITFYFLTLVDRLRVPGIRLLAFAMAGVFLFLLFPFVNVGTESISSIEELVRYWRLNVFATPGVSLIASAAYLGTVVAGNNFMHMRERLQKASQARQNLLSSFDSKANAFANMAKELMMRDSDWNIESGTTYLNHGSFGPPLIGVRHVQLDWQTRCNQQPMDFFVRQLEPAWIAARKSLADFVDCPEDCLIFSENATASMNHLASFFPLSPGDEVLLNDHEYGVVKRIWQRRCQEAQAVYREVKLPLPMTTPEAVVETIASGVNQRTRLIVVSHITSPTAITLPLEQIIAMAKDRGVAVCVDGPHAPLQIPLQISRLGCDFYLASCHKWLSAPFGTGFTYVAEQWHDQAAKPLALSWGRLPPTPLQHWYDHHLWCGTRDYSGYLSIPAAIEIFQKKGPDKTRQRNHELAKFARSSLMKALGTDALVPNDPKWFSMMAAVWLPNGDHADLQKRLWANHRIEVPIVHFDSRYLVRVSCHLYNSEVDVDKLVVALKAELKLD